MHSNLHSRFSVDSSNAGHDLIVSRAFQAQQIPSLPSAIVSELSEDVGNKDISADKRWSSAHLEFDNVIQEAACEDTQTHIELTQGLMTEDSRARRRSILLKPIAEIKPG